MPDIQDFKKTDFCHHLSTTDGSTDFIGIMPTTVLERLFLRFCFALLRSFMNVPEMFRDE